MDPVIEDNILKGAVTPIDTESKLGQIVLDALNVDPNHVFQIDAETGEETTCREMKERSIRCALWMKKLGVKPDDVIVNCTHNHLNSYVPVFATFFLDAVFSAWNQNITLYTARRYMKQFTPRLIFTCEKAADVLQEAAKLENLDVELVVFGEHSGLTAFSDIMDSQISEDVDKFELVNVKSSEDLTAIMLSSGSTGFPKGVMLSNKSFVVQLPKQTGPTIRFMWYSTLDWATCLTFLLQTTVQNNTAVIPTQCEVENFFGIVEKYKVNYVFIPPILVSYVAKSDSVKNYDLKSLKAIMLGGSKLGKEILETLKRKIPTAFIGQGYGTTELGGIAFSTPKVKHVESIGLLAPNRQAKIVDLQSGKTLGPNELGELCVKSPAAMIGYYNDPEATEKAFDEEGWYHTGDLAYYNEAGEIFIANRIKEIMKYRNHQISPAEIEELLLSHPDVQEAAVVAVPHELDGDWPAAFVKLRPGSQVTEDDIVKHTSVLEDYKRLRGGIHFIDSLPQTGSGKIAKNELKQLAKDLIKNKSEVLI